MALKIRWSPEADATFDSIVHYLETEWTEKEVRKFVAKTLKLIGQISENPKMFKASGVEKVRKATVAKHNSLFYLIDEANQRIILLTFWDNRQKSVQIEILTANAEGICS
jgi:plasmid stabilization system protein ParE